MDTQPYRVKPGAVLAHDCQDLPAGTDVSLPPHVAYEVRHLVDPIDPVTGETRAWGHPAAEALEIELGKARPHERISLIQQALDANTADGDKLRALLKSEQQQNEKATKQLEKPKPGPGPKVSVAPGGSGSGGAGTHESK